MQSKFKLLLILIIVFIQGYSQNNEYRFRNLSTSNGLSQGSVIAIHQDKLGQMWFGTRDGLNKYDGIHFKIFTHNPKDSSTISNSDILAIEEDALGNIWVGTYNGLNCYNPKKNTFKKYFHTNNTNSLSNNTIWCIKEMNNEIWFGTSNGISIYNKTTETFQTIFHAPDNPESLPSNFVLKIIATKNGEIWVGTSQGFCKLIKRDNTNFTFKRYSTTIKNSENDEHLYVQDILEDEDANLWIATKNSGLLKYNTTNNTYISFLNNENNSDFDSDFRSLDIDNSGNLWVGSYDGVFVIKNKNGFQKTTINKIDNKNLIKIKSIYTDKKGSVWVGTYYGGVSIWDESNANFTNINETSSNYNLNFNVVSSITADQNKNIYVGTEGGGISILNNTNNSSFLNTTNTKGLPTNNIKTLLLANENELWIGTIGNGLAVYNTQKEEITKNLISNELQQLLNNVGVYVIKIETPDIFWLGTFGNGLIRYNTNNKNFEVFKNEKNNNFSLTNNRIRSLLIDSNSQVWVGTQSGLNLITSSNSNSTEKIKHFFFNTEALAGDDILTLFEDSKGSIWAGIKAKGLYKFNGNSFEKITLMDGYFEISSIHSVLEDARGNLWLSSNHGIVKYNPNSNQTTVYTQADGLISNEYNDNSSLAFADNQFYFGGPMGISYFDPEKIVSNDYAPQVILTDFKIKNKTIEASNDKNAVLNNAITYSKKIALNYDLANFTISFAMPNFINSTNNQYSYRLVGLENQWTTTSNTEATYIIQNPGTYTFEVKGANNNGVWNTTLTTLQITVKPAPWRSWWAFSLYALIIAFALIALILFLKSKDKLKLELALEHAENVRNEEINQAKLQFFTNISHEFRTPLTLILGPLQQLLSNYKGSNSMHKKLLVIENSANHLLQLINRLMDFRKLENNQSKLHAAEGNIVKFLREIYFSFSEYAKDGNYSYTFEASEDPILVYYDRSKLERVFYNLISNAFRFTPKGGNIAIKVRCDKNSIFICVEDSGVGIADEFVDKIFDRFFEIAIHNNPAKDYNKGTGIGLSIAKNSVTLHKGDILVKKNQPQGTIFEVVLPLGRLHLTNEEILNNFKVSDDLSQYVTQLETESINFEDDIEDLILNEEKPVVLIVEDNKPLRSFIKNLLKKECNVVEAENGKIGLKKALETIPDLIISDIIMPEMVGTELCSQVKANIKTSHIPVILLTSRSSLIYKFEGLESGADEYISKPFNVKEFQLKVKNMLEAIERLKNKFTNEDILSPSEIAVSSVDEQLLKKAFKIVEDNISNEQFDIPLFCSELGVSRTMLFTKIKAWTNFTPNDFIQEIRMKRAAQLLEQNKINISQISYKVGFNNPKYFSKCFQKRYGETPSQYQNKFSQDFLD
jgi:signal transduction histidine kinase/ligand-binding sensor domain-containing protein/DNA-binding response OmpR family regulator